MNNRIEKVNSLLEHEVSKIILKDFDFFGALVTLTHVEASGNLIEAKAYISVMFTHRSFNEGGPEENIDKIIKTLNNNAYSIQQEINKKLFMRPIPKIIFVKDEKIAEAAKIETLINKLKKEEK